MIKSVIKNSGLLLSPGAIVTVKPAAATAETFYTFQFIIKLGKNGLGPDDSIGLVCGSNIDRWHSQFMTHRWGQFCPWQIKNSNSSNYVTAKCNHPNVQIKLKVGSSGILKPSHNQARSMITSLRNRERYVLEIIPKGNAIKAWDKITITWGDRSGGGPGVMTPILGARYYLLIFQYSRLPEWDRDFPYRSGKFEEMPCIRITGKRAKRFHIAVQPLLGMKEKFSMHVAAIDEYGNLDENFRGKITVKSTDSKALLPKSYQFKITDKGSHRFENLSFKTTGWQSITVSGGRINGISNMIRVSERLPEKRIYFGEMHAHTIDCDGTLTAEDHFDYAMNTAGLDFGSLSSHSEYFGTKEAWERYLKAASRAHIPGKFVSFYGYEWAGEGHSNAYFLKKKDVVNMYGKNILWGRHPMDNPSFRSPCHSQNAFTRKLRRLDVPVIAIAHFHTSFTASFDDEIERLFEVYSCHQRPEFESILRKVLSQGLKMGMVCGSDTHQLPIGSLMPHPQKICPQPAGIGSQSVQNKCGLQATFSKKPTREGIWNGMFRHHTYGTTGARIVLMLNLGSNSAGESVFLEPGACPHFTGFVGGTDILKQILLCRWDGKSWKDLNIETLGKKTCEIDFTDTSLSSRSVYYLKVIQEDSEKAYSSPIWVKSVP